MSCRSKEALRPLNSANGDSVLMISNDILKRDGLIFDEFVCNRTFNKSKGCVKHEARAEAYPKTIINEPAWRNVGDRDNQIILDDISQNLPLRPDKKDILLFL